MRDNDTRASRIRVRCCVACISDQDMAKMTSACLVQSLLMFTGSVNTWIRSATGLSVEAGQTISPRFSIPAAWGNTVMLGSASPLTEMKRSFIDAKEKHPDGKAKLLCSDKTAEAKLFSSNFFCRVPLAKEAN